MTYVEGFLTPVPVARRDAYRAHADRAADLLLELGVTRLVETWGEDVPHGVRTDMHRAVQATPDEAVLFSWFEYPDRATRDAANDRIRSDPRFADMGRDMPFDARRMIYGGFASVSDVVGGGGGGKAGFVDGVVLPVRGGARDAYRDHAAALAPLFVEHGALRVIDAIADDVPAGEVTDFARAVAIEDREEVGFGWVEWPSRAVRDDAWARLMADGRMTAAGDPPWNGQRMIFGGFAVLLDRTA
ncbi:DUF1428 domain-containing protein [Sphingomonas adhaesiva]|uniref:DUF1428 domain-containing protein n=1 Tax=Sphingomonas adhaesiva TaxID=28212 RepID=UPI002FFADCDA